MSKTQLKKEIFFVLPDNNDAKEPSKLQRIGMDPLN